MKKFGVYRRTELYYTQNRLCAECGKLIYWKNANSKVNSNITVDHVYERQYGYGLTYNALIMHRKCNSSTKNRRGKPSGCNLIWLDYINNCTNFWKNNGVDNIPKKSRFTCYEEK